jgi:hypothetical protein
MVKLKISGKVNANGRCADFRTGKPSEPLI